MATQRVLVAAVCSVLFLGLCAGIGVYLWQDYEDEQNEPPIGEHAVPVGEAFTLKYNDYRGLLKFSAGSVQAYLGREGVDTVGGAPCQSGHTVCADYKGAGLRLTINSTEGSPNMECARITWSMTSPRQLGLESARDCYVMEGSSWFGGFEDFSQPWALGEEFSKRMQPFVTGDAFSASGFGNVIHPMFISSAGVGIHVDAATPLYVSVNQPDKTPGLPTESSKLGKICLKARTGPDTPYSFARPYLVYDVCKATDIKTLWSEMQKKYIPRPNKTISAEVIKKPIWTTWAIYKANINKAKVLAFADKIKSNNFSVSQLEIDDEWTPNYGDLVFDSNKFPDARGMISSLRFKDVPVTVWVHPFVNKDAQTYNSLSKANDLSGPVNWWRGNDSGIYDLTKPDAIKKFKDSLNNLKNNFGVASFKFDAGETNYLLQNSSMVKNLTNPSYYSTAWAGLAFESDSSMRQEVRVGYRSQQFGMMVRMIDRQSSWDRKLGLKTVIPCALAFSIMGYPFILPDMIGGNAYDSTDIDKVVLPDSELYIRWLQASTFLPVMQFSIGPWVYNDTRVTSIAQKFVKLHEDHSDLIIRLAQGAVDHGTPIIRPTWWADPADPVTLTLDTQFLLGDDLLVAPVLEKGARSRDVYLPRGRWRDELRGVEVAGPTWLNVKAELDQLPYFTRV